MQKNHPEIRRICHVLWRYRPELKVFTGSMRMGMIKTREKVMEHIAGYIKRLGLYGVNYPLGNASAEDVKFLHDNGAKWVSLYFVQNTEDAETVRSWGMDAFVTDYVSKVRKAYELKK
jgi:glycerophosphoryl diester phosphodiesterase